VEEAKGLVERDGLKAHLGEKVDYNPIGGGTWRIFYYDDEDQGNGKGYFGDDVGTVYLKRDFVSRDIVLNNYSNYNPTDNGAMMKQMNPKWRDSSYSIIDLENEHCVAWLCDIAQWTNYKVDGVSKYAIGSTSVEMYMKAFNVYQENDTALINKVESQYGYSLGAHNSYTWNGSNEHQTGTNSIEAGPNNIFVIGEGYYWKLASPASHSGNAVVAGYGPGAFLYGCNDMSAFGICPIVALL